MEDMEGPAEMGYGYGWGWMGMAIWRMMGIWGIWDWEAIDIDRYMSFGEDVDISTCVFFGR